MADPLDDLQARFARAIASAFGADHAHADPVLRRSAQPQFGDYQANGAMALAKALGRSPRDVAAAIVEHLDLGGVAEAPEVAGPGFLNIRLLPDYLGAKVSALVGDRRLGVDISAAPETVVVDYSQPNVAKEMHVGHLRSTIIGDAIVRVLEFLGHRVIRQNHLGDWGTNFGMLIEHLTDLGEDEAASELSLGDLEAFYREAKAKFDNDASFAERARLRVVALQGGDPTTLCQWRLLIDQSTRYFSAVYDLLGVRLTPDDIAGESFYNPMLADVAADLEAKGLAVLDAGALCIFPPGFVGRDGKPFPLMVRKSDGGFGYDATDLAALRYRVQELGADRIIYVVDARQSQHFALLFKAGEMAGWLGGSVGRRAEHVAFGAVLGSDGRPFKTRAGGTVKLIALLQEAIERAQAVVAEKNPDLDPATRTEIARQVGIGAVKYADLSNDRAKDYVFDLDRMLAMDGNTGPYLQYAHVRARSIGRRVAESGASESAEGAAVVITEPAERTLALQLLSLEAVIESTAETLQPHRLTTYLFELAGTFTTFFEHCPVLRADTPEQRASRLVLTDLTAATLRLGLELLGIEAPDRM